MQHMFIGVMLVMAWVFGYATAQLNVVLFYLRYNAGSTTSLYQCDGQVDAQLYDAVGFVH